MAVIWVAIGIDHRDLNTVDEADRVDAHLAICETIVGPFRGRSIEHPGRILKGDPMAADIAGVFRRIPGEPDPGCLRNVFTYVEI